MNKSRDTYIPYTVAGFAALAVGVFLYVYFVNVSIIEVVMRKELMHEQNELHTKIALLETSYIEAQHQVAARIAELDGYEHDTAKLFVSRDSASFALNRE